MSSERVFTMEDQHRFASLSGDFNPMHVDPLHARRLMLGKVVIHGIHTLLWGLDVALTGHSPVSIQSLDTKFMKPVGVDQAVRASWEWQDDVLELELFSGQHLVVLTKATFGPVKTAAPESNPDLPPVKTCTTLTRQAMQASLEEKLCLHYNADLGDELFPHLAHTLPVDQIAALLLASRTIGMCCPGQHSIFSGLKLSAPDQPLPENGAGFRLDTFDDRFSFSSIAFETPALTGVLTAFLRPDLTHQASYESIRALVKDHDFSQIKGLVIGGSRGLGEITSKILAAGGADVRLTYFKGEEDAKKVCEEIAENGGKCSYHELDIGDPSDGIKSILSDDWKPTDLYYYPTPSIFVGGQGAFSSSLFDTFCEYYVHGFTRLLGTIGYDAMSLQVLYPSTVAVEELPPDMMEYASAKAAGENLCANLSAQFPNLAISTPRFPRLDTDQTASLYPVDNADPAPIILDALKQMVNSE